MVKTVDNVDTRVRIERMTQAEKVASRREYQRRWMASKRKAIKQAGGAEELKLMLPKALLADLRARKPHGLSLKQWLVVFLRESLPPQTASIKPDQRASFPRNAPCPCGSGKKFKVCCGNLS